VELATSDFIAFLDADDEWMPKHLETIVRLIEKFPDAGMYSTSYKIQDTEGIMRRASYSGIPNPPWEGIIPDYFRSAALGDHPINSTAVAIPKKIFIEMGGFPEGYWYGGDIDLFGRIALKYPVAFSREFGAIYHWDATNRVCERKYPKDYQEPFFETARTALIKGEVKPEFIESVNEYVAHREIFHAINFIRCGSRDVGESILKQVSTKWHSKEKQKWLLLAKLPYPLFLFIQDFRRRLMKIGRKN
jgi:glycosyltransferase involved in cell wall biosynthesis